MTQRSPIVVLILWCITLGIYPLIWIVSTKNEMNQKFNTGIPTAWLIIVPIVQFWWSYKFWAGAEKVTGVSWILGFLLGPIGAFVVQGKLNTAGAGGAQMRAA